MSHINIKNIQKTFCKLLGNYWLVFVAGLTVIILLYLFREVFERILFVYLTLLVLIGLYVLSRITATVVRERCRKAKAGPKGQGSESEIGAPSIKIPYSIYKKPDPLIYSQTYLMSQGFAVTWDSPDIHLEHNGLLVPSNELAPSTKYRIKAKVWNSSIDAPVVNLLVRFFYLTFGIGTTRTLIGGTHVNVPVKGADGVPAIAEYDWTTPSIQGHYCLQAELVWSDDANPANNLGQENVDVKPLNSPTATFKFPVRNSAPTKRTFKFETDSYTIPPLLKCNALSGSDGVGLIDANNDQTRNSYTTVYSRHKRDAHPIPNDWVVDLLPSNIIDFEPGEEQMITVKVTTEKNIIDKQAINVNAYAGIDFVGGVTLYFHS